MIVDRIEEVAARLIEAVAILLMAALIGAICYSVAARQFFKLSVAWSEEVGAGLLAWMVLLGAAAAWSRRRHIVIDVVLRRLPLRLRWILSIAIEMASLVLFLVIFDGAISMMERSAHSSTTALGISYTWLYLALAIGLGAMIVFSLLHLWRLLVRGTAVVEREAAEPEWSTS
jgi:TRAP-type C4-dicarboxylate transport system permease small subunit